MPMRIVALFLMLSLFTACAYHLPEVTKRASLPFALGEDIRDVLYYASLAPSGHNSQPWRAVIYPQESVIEVFYDGGRALNKIDPDSRESYISVGAFVTNMLKAFDAYCYDTSFTINKIISDSSPVATVSYSPRGGCTAPDDFALNALKTRFSDKTPYKMTELPENLVSRLAEHAPDNFHYYPAGSEGFNYLARKSIEADAANNSDNETRAELADWLRLSDTEVREKRDGLAAENVGMTGIGKWFYYTFMTKNIAKSKFFAEKGGAILEKNLNNAAGLIVITSPDNASDWVKSGMMAEALWLEAVNSGLSACPTSSMVENILMRDTAKDDLKLERPIQMILRVGFPSGKGINFKVRRGLSEFVSLGAR